MTAELALSLPALTVALTAVLAVGQVVAAQVQCLDAARAGARAAARGESDPRVLSAGRAVGPPGARVEVSRAAASVTVRVSTPVDLVLPGVPSVTISGTASADAELRADAATR